MAARVEQALRDQPCSRVELRVKAMGLSNLDTFSKSDPMCVLFLNHEGSWVEVGRTEVIKDCLSPEWTRSFVVDYFFEEAQELWFAVYDSDAHANAALDAHDYVGEVKTSLGNIIGSTGQTLVKELVHPTRRGVGRLQVFAEELENMKVTVRTQFAGKKLDKKDFWGKSDPYLVISKSRESGDWVVVFQSEVIKNNLNPTWQPVELQLGQLCNGDLDRPMKFEIFDWNKSGIPEFIGEVTLSVNDINGSVSKEFPVVDRAKTGKKGYNNSGFLRMLGWTQIRHDSFLDYIAGGCEISLQVAVDFTASNGDIRYTNSLHYRNPYEPNEYMKAIRGVGDVLAPYDSDNMIPAFGYGAKLPPDWQVSHCFALNGNAANPEVHGVDGLLAAYVAALDNVKLFGPTNFRQIINTAAVSASGGVNQQRQRYSILLIVTDGEITDIDATMAEIVNASALPLSIVIVGVGSADFQSMNLLDGDDRRVSANGKFAERDIVQFVPFRDFRSQAALAKATLAEIPDQFLQYMKKNQIKPNPPVAYVPPPYTEPTPSYPPPPTADLPPPPAY